MKVELSAFTPASSNIQFIEYISSKDVPLKRDDRGLLRVIFNNGSVYVYENVPFKIAVDILYAESVGKKFNSAIVSSNYAYRKEK